MFDIGFTEICKIEVNHLIVGVYLSQENQEWDLPKSLCPWWKGKWLSLSAQAPTFLLSSRKKSNVSIAKM